MFSVDAEPLLKEVTKSLIIQLVRYINEYNDVSTMSEEDIIQTAIESKLWQVDTFPFINSGRFYCIANNQDMEFELLCLI